MIIPALIVAGIALAAMGGTRGSAAPPQAPTGGPPRPVAVGSAAEVSGHLRELDAYLRSQGVDTRFFSAAELTVMPRAPGRPHAIPPKAYWPGMAFLIREVAQPLRRQMGVPFTLRAYRPPDYNAAVGGAPGSRHQYFDAMDIYVEPVQARKLALSAANIYRAKGARIKMGFGAYGYPTPTNIHVDAGGRRQAVAYREAPRYLEDVSRVS
jgi:hypothetical protein